MTTSPSTEWNTSSNEFMISIVRPRCFPMIAPSTEGIINMLTFNFFNDICQFDIRLVDGLNLDHNRIVMHVNSSNNGDR